MYAAHSRDQGNSWAYRNLGACLLKAGRTDEALEHLRRATALNPKDQNARFGLAEALIALGRDTEADKVYETAIDINEYCDIAELAREALPQVGRRNVQGTNTRTPRPDAVMYCVGALKKFEKMPRDEMRWIASEIAMKGRIGLDTNDPAQKYQLKSLPGIFSGLHLVCLMYVAFKSIAPDLDIGFDLSEEFAAAQELYRKETVH